MLDILSNNSIMSEYPLKKIIRYNHRNRLQNESVAEHTCFVSIFCLKIMAQLNLSHEQERQVLILAALHDTCESRTSDIPHDVKVNYPEMEDVLNSIEDEYYKEHWPTYYGDIYSPSEIAYCILKLADAYSVYQWCINEKELGHNSDRIRDIFSDAYNRIVGYTNKINDIIKKENE